MSPTIFRYKNYRFFFFSNEGHEPLHVHVESAGRYAKYWLEPVSLERSIGFNAAELSRLRQIVSDKRLRFLEKWHEYFSR